MMGGSGAHEYMAPCAAGENDVALSDAATPPTSRSRAPSRSPSRLPPPLDAAEPVETPAPRRSTP